MPDSYPVMVEKLLSSKPIGFQFTVRNLLDECKVSTGSRGGFDSTIRRLHEEAKLKSFPPRDKTKGTVYEIIKPIPAPQELEIETNPLAFYTDKQLRAELRRRKK